MRRSDALRCSLSVLAAAAIAPAQNAPTPLATFPCNNHPPVFVDLFGIAVMTVDDELWRSDGTAAGTYHLMTLASSTYAQTHPLVPWVTASTSSTSTRRLAKNSG